MNALVVTIRTLEQARDGGLKMNAEQFKSVENTIHIMKKAQTIITKNKKKKKK